MMMTSLSLNPANDPSSMYTTLLNSSRDCYNYQNAIYVRDCVGNTISVNNNNNKVVSNNASSLDTERLNSALARLIVSSVSRPADLQSHLLAGGEVSVKAVQQQQQPQPRLPLDCDDVQPSLAAALAAAAADLSAVGSAAFCRYKTELCRPFEENGTCKYGDKCQFAHGRAELRPVVRHPKYKTDLCKTYHSTGLCPYGPRCHFIHNDEERRLNEANRVVIEQQRSLLQQQHLQRQDDMLQTAAVVMLAQQQQQQRRQLEHGAPTAILIPAGGVRQQPQAMQLVSSAGRDRVLQTPRTTSIDSGASSGGSPVPSPTFADDPVRWGGDRFCVQPSPLSPTDQKLQQLGALSRNGAARGRYVDQVSLSDDAAVTLTVLARRVREAAPQLSDAELQTVLGRLVVLQSSLGGTQQQQQQQQPGSLDARCTFTVNAPAGRHPSSSWQQHQQPHHGLTSHLTQ